MFNFFKNSKKLNVASDKLFILLNQYARNKEFFGDGKIADDPDGRFEAVALFSAAIYFGFADKGEEYKKLSQKLFDKIFASFDNALRDLGVGDSQVSKRIRKMAESYYGRQKSYIEAAKSEIESELASKIALNVLSKTNEIGAFEHELSLKFHELVAKAKHFDID